MSVPIVGAAVTCAEQRTIVFSKPKHNNECMILVTKSMTQGLSLYQSHALHGFKGVA
jgi:hypothetical protein